MQQSELDLNLIKAFVAVIEHGNYTKASRFMGIPKSKLSRQITHLEKEMNIQLIYRTTRSIELTQAGRLFYSKSKLHLEEIQNAITDLQHMNEKIEGTIRVTAPDDFAIVVMAPICDAFLRHHPQVKFDFLITGEIVDLVKNAVDVAIRVGHLKDSSLISRHLGKLKMILVSSPNYLEKFQARPNISNLNHYSFLQFNPSQSKLNLKFTNSKEIHTLKCEPIFSSSNLMLIKEMTLLGRGISALPDFLIKEELKTGQLVHILKDWAGQEVPVQIVTPPRKEKQNIIRRFIDFTSENIETYL